MLGFRFDDLDAGVGENLEVNLVAAWSTMYANSRRRAAEFHVVTMATLIGAAFSSRSEMKLSQR